MAQVDDLCRSLIAFEQNSGLVVVLEKSQSSWLAAGVVPGLEKLSLKKFDPDPSTLLRLVEGWRDRAMKVGRMIIRIVLGFPAGRILVSPLVACSRCRAICHPDRSRRALDGD